MKSLTALTLPLCFYASVGLADTTGQIPYRDGSEPEWTQISQLADKEAQLFIPTRSEQSTSRSWALAFDNDIFIPGGRDQDYTYGLNFTQSGTSASNALFSLHTPLVTIDSLLGNTHGTIATNETFSREVGIFGFTPEDISISIANPSDRPYASLIYLSNSREQVDLVNNVAWKSTLTIGALGLAIAGELQDLVHEVTDSAKPQGWQNQISDGGELTGRYAIARQRYFDAAIGGTEIKTTVQASVGYLTEASWSLSLRKGAVHSPWSSFNPELASYGEKSSYSSEAKLIDEHYFWAGLAIKARAYNAFLEGQFRNSTVSYDRHQLRPLLVEAWAGYTLAFKHGYRISYVLRGHSSEIKEGAGDRNLLWGGIILARNL